MSVSDDHANDAKLSDDVTVGNTQSSLDEDIKNEPHNSEKVTEAVPIGTEDYPDGGLRAWLIVVGVSRS